MDTQTAPSTPLGIDAVKRIFDGIGRSAIIGFFIAYDGLGLDDVGKLFTALPDLTETFGDFAQAPVAMAELKDLTLEEVADLNVYQALTLQKAMQAITRIQTTGTYKEIQAKKFPK